ncbi:hypothetical protein J9332_40615, partial [Aquimarina celericrescens]|nr:hypothetical protein [Aquimarina celericrescens]
GRDLSATYDLKKLNELPLSSHFDKNINIIRTASFFEAVEEMENEFVLPSILLKTQREQALNIISFINRIALLIVNADGTITEKERGFLKQM